MKEITVTKETILELRDWEKADKPRMWLSVEKLDDYEVQIDVGYGGVRLLKNNLEIARTNQTEIIQDDIIVIDKEYYSATKYIWK